MNTIPRTLTIVFVVCVLNGVSAARSTPGDAPRVVHVFVALCDNEHQGVVPVPAALGNGEDPGRNLYWGALYGVKTHFKRSGSFELILNLKRPSASVLERCVFKQRDSTVYLVADAYRGRSIRQAVTDFLQAASGLRKETVTVSRKGASDVELDTASGSDLLAYVGHNGLLDFTLDITPLKSDGRSRPVIVLACLSRMFFTDVLQKAGARPMLWTTGLLAPEAYVLRAAVESWAAGEGDAAAADRAAEAYHRYQKCGLKASKKLLVTGW